MSDGKLDRGGLESIVRRALPSVTKGKLDNYFKAASSMG